MEWFSKNSSSFKLFSSRFVLTLYSSYKENWGLGGKEWLTHELLTKGLFIYYLDTSVQESDKMYTSLSIRLFPVSISTKKNT